MRHDGRHLGHGLDRLQREILRMRRREADALDAGLPHRTQQLSEARLTMDVATIRVDVLSEERYLTHPAAHKTSYFIDDGVERTALLASAYIRNDAVRAEVIAARHDGHPRVERLLSMPGKRCSCRQVALRRVDMALVILESLSQELAHMRDGLRAEDDVDVVDMRKEALAIALSNAAANRDHTLARWWYGKALA